MRIERYPETLAVVRLGAGAEVPAWAESSSVFSVTATATETSLVCAARNVPAKSVHHKPLTAFELEGRADPGEPGPLADLLAPLAEAGISAFPLATYDAGWILVPTARADDAAEEWRRQGHDVDAAVPAPPTRSRKK